MATYTTYEEKRMMVTNRDYFAFAFTEDGTRDGMALKQPPVRGRIVTGDKVKDGTSRFELYFVPCRKSGDGLAFSRAIWMQSRCYADTEEEAKEAYNQKINDEIAWHQARIGDLRKELL